MEKANRVIYKYPLRTQRLSNGHDRYAPPEPGEIIEVEIPKGSMILSCAFQANNLVMWAETDPFQKETEKVKVVAYFTGQPYEEPDNEMRTHIGTVTSPQGLVYHLFVIEDMTEDGYEPYEPV